MADIEKFKKWLLQQHEKQCILSQSVIEQLSHVHTPEEALRVLSELDATLQTKLQVEIRTDGEPSNILRQMSKLRELVIHVLDDEQQRRYMNEHWSKILQEELKGAEQETEDTRKEAKKDDNRDVVAEIISELREEVKKLTALIPPPKPSQANKEQDLEERNSILKNTKNLLEKLSALVILRKIFSVEPKLRAEHEPKQSISIAHTDSYKSPTPFPTVPRPGLDKR